MVGFRPTSVEDLLVAAPPTVRALAEAARRLVIAVVPPAVERLRPGWGLIGYNAPAYFAFIAVDRDAIRIGFEWGVLLPDPTGLLEGAGSQVRHVTVRSAATLADPALASLVLAASRLVPPRRSRARRTG